MNTSISSIERIQAKLAGISASNEFSNKSAEEYNTPFPLDALLILFNKAHYDCMLDYMQGFKLLNNWLSPIVSPTEYKVDLACKYPTINSYDVQRLSAILGIDQSIIIETMIELIKRDSL